MIFLWQIINDEEHIFNSSNCLLSKCDFFELEQVTLSKRFTQYTLQLFAYRQHKTVKFPIRPTQFKRIPVVPFRNRGQQHDSRSSPDWSFGGNRFQRAAVGWEFFNNKSQLILSGFLATMIQSSWWMASPMASQAMQDQLPSMILRSRNREWLSWTSWPMEEVETLTSMSREMTIQRNQTIFLQMPMIYNYHLQEKQLWCEECTSWQSGANYCWSTCTWKVIVQEDLLPFTHCSRYFIVLYGYESYNMVGFEAEYR